MAKYIAKNLNIQLANEVKISVMQTLERSEDGAVRFQTVSVYSLIRK